MRLSKHAREGRWLTANDVCILMGVSRATVKRWIGDVAPIVENRGCGTCSTRWSAEPHLTVYSKYHQGL